MQTLYNHLKILFGDIKTSDKHHHQTKQDVELKAERRFQIVLKLLTL